MLRELARIFRQLEVEDRERIDEAREELFGILENDEMRGVPVVVMVNKQDLPREYFRLPPDM